MSNMIIIENKDKRAAFFDLMKKWDKNFIHLNEIIKYNSHDDLKKLLIKYLALGNKSFFIDDIELFKWNTISDTSKILDILKELVDKYKINVTVTTNLKE